MSIFKDKVLMVTGGTGSFGNAVVRRFLESDIKEIRILSRDEKKQDDMRHLFQSKYPNSFTKVKFYIGDVSIDDDLPEISISTENIKGDKVPYVVAVKVTASVSSEGSYFLDDDGNTTDKTYITKTITENGTVITPETPLGNAFVEYLEKRGTYKIAVTDKDTNLLLQSFTGDIKSRTHIRASGMNKSIKYLH